VSASFSCDLGALSAAERERHRELLRELREAVLSRNELASGYAFDISDTKMSWLRLAEWVGLESRCCPFFDFHISQARDRGAMTLELSGEPGIKSVIEMELMK
jgi:hypothetical protein